MCRCMIRYKSLYQNQKRQYVHRMKEKNEWEEISGRRQEGQKQGRLSRLSTQRLAQIREGYVVDGFRGSCFGGLLSSGDLFLLF